MMEKSDKFTRPFGFGAVGNANSIFKPVPMKLFATWEVDRTPSYCIPRQCLISINHINLMKSLGPDISSVVLAVKMQQSKRILRSSEILISSTNLLDTDLDLTFSLQYPHFLKREKNKLLILLQRRKKYKNRTILGFKTLAVGMVDMDQVLQHSVNAELELYSDLKEKMNAIAKVQLMDVHSLPVEQPNDHADEACNKIVRQNRLVLEDSEEEDETSSQEEGSDSEPMLEDGNPGLVGRLRKTNRSKILAMPRNARQRNLKQKFISLLKKFKVNEDLHGLEADHGSLTSKLSRGDIVDADEIEDLFNELENLSDSGPEMDTLSVSSTPKPCLRPFFSSSKSLVNETNYDPASTFGIEANSSAPKFSSIGDPLSNASLDQFGSQSFSGDGYSIDSQDAHDDTDVLSRDRNSLFKNLKINEAKKVLEQLHKGFGDDNTIPESMILVGVSHPTGEALFNLLHKHHLSVIKCENGTDVRTSLSVLISKIQKFCNTNSKTPVPIKVVVLGSNSFFNLLLKPYVELLSNKPPDWNLYIRFLLIPIGPHQISKYLGSIDSLYHTLFLDPSWKEICENCDLVQEHGEEIINRLARYISDANTNIHLPVAEAMMINYSDKGSGSEISQTFTPFLNEVSIGFPEVTGCSSVDLDDLQNNLHGGGSPPQLGSLEKAQMSIVGSREATTPPSSPNINTSMLNANSSFPRDAASLLATEPMDLQVEYWLISGKGPEKDMKKDKTESSRVSIKACFKKLAVQRTPPLGDLNSSSLLLTYSVKDKRQKNKSSEIVQFGIQEAFTSVMRLGKKKEKDKEIESKMHQVENINRLICVSKHQDTPLKIFIDGVERNNVKFFQLSAQWPTQIKTFPVALFHISETNL